MYDQGYTHGQAGAPKDEHLAMYSDYYVGYECGVADASETAEVNKIAQEYLDGLKDGLAGDEFEIALLESEAYHAGFQDRKGMLKVVS